MGNGDLVSVVCSYRTAREYLFFSICILIQGTAASTKLFLLSVLHIAPMPK